MTNPTSYFRPQTLAEAVERAARPGSIALAGGALALGGLTLPYETIVDLQDLTELQQIRRDEDGLHIGGGSALQSVVEASFTPDKLKLALTRSIPLNIRNNTSVGESLMVKDPPREWLAVLLVLDTQIEHAGRLTASDQSTLWEQPLDEFIQYLHLHQHPYQGVITRLHIPPMNNHTAIGTAFVARTPADAPIVNAAVRVTLGQHGNVSSAVAAVGGASHVPVIAFELAPLVGGPLSDASISAALEVAASNAHPIGDYRGSVEYRLEMAQVMVRRALTDCIDQLSGGKPA